MKRRTALGLLCAAAPFAVVSPAVAGSGYKNKYPSETVVADCGDSHTVTYAGPLKMWPPNHKLQDVSVTATDADGDSTDGVTLDINVPVTDATGGDGGPTHDPDVMFPAGPVASGDGSTTVPFQLRAERSGEGTGRTYHISGMATFDDGGDSCSISFEVLVPHDMRGGADWKP